MILLIFIFMGVIPVVQPKGEGWEEGWEGMRMGGGLGWGGGEGEREDEWKDGSDSSCTYSKLLIQ